MGERTMKYLTALKGNLLYIVDSVISGTVAILRVSVAAIAEDLVSETLQNAVAAVGNGTAILMQGYNGLTLEVSGAFVATVSFEGSIDGGVTYFAVGLKTAADGAAVTSAAAVGAFKLPADGPRLTHLRARVSAYTSGNVTVKSVKHPR